MAKRTPPPTLKRQPAPSAASHQTRAAAIRETIESVAIAFVLAFLFRTFEAEAFVIPTGSMAPTLMGRHKDLVCPECGYNFQVSASEEVERDGSQKHISHPEEALVDRCICPMCRYPLREKDGLIKQPTYNGDRILVNKFAYQFDDPQRWDVIVFKYPGGAQENYIKRLIGLPKESIRVFRGNIWIRQDDGSFKIARKPPEKLRAMLQSVFDNDMMPEIEKLGWPVRWRSELPADGGTAGQWTSSDHAVYETDGNAAGETWLRYQHLVPSLNQWREREGGLPENQDPVKPQLITDFAAYNAGSTEYDRAGHQFARENIGQHWVGDLALQCRAEVENDRGQIVLELVQGGRQFQCRLDVATGRADLSIDGIDKKMYDPQAQTAVRGPGIYDLMFANCDQKLYLWINGGAVAFAAPTEYGDLHNGRPTPADLQPAGVASAGVKMKLSHLKIFRDIYYIATSQMGRMHDYRTGPRDLLTGNAERFFSDPSQWSAFDDNNMEYADFTLGTDEFFAMGDNSAKSADSRFWGPVPRDLLIGKAFFTYWPHSWDRLPATKIPFPFSPNFPRMGFVR